MGENSQDAEMAITQKEEDTIWSWNAYLPPTPNSTIAQIFSKQVKQSPDAPAVDAPDGIITYGQLDTYSTHLALHLRGILSDNTNEETVPICFDRSIWLVVCMMAVSKAGMAYATFDPSHPTDRLHTCLATINPRVILVEEKFRERFLNTDLNVISNIPEICGAGDEKHTVADLPIGSPDDLAYVCFTSGSTGVPKVVQHTQSSAISNVIDDEGYTSGCCVLNAASPAFAAMIVLVLKTLCNGGLLLLPPERERMGGLANFITKKGITTMFLTPTQLNLLKPEDVKCLKYLLVAGEPVTQKLIDIWAPHLTLSEGFGMTEGAGMRSIVDKSGKKSRSRQTATGCVWIVDPDDVNALTPIGETGELCFEGPSLFQGYRNNPEANAYSIIEGPPAWAKKRGEQRPRKLFRSGDLAKYIEDGVVQIVGRKDSRVKLYGQRFELGEVEKSMISFLPTGATVAAGIVEPANGYNGPMLVAHIHGISSDFTKEVKQLREKMAATLPEYMVPRGFVELKDRPLNASGKLDRMLLRKRASEIPLTELIKHTVSSEKTQPVTLQEKTMQRLWAAVLGLPVDYIGLDDEFFYLGGDSLQSMKLITAARKENVVLNIEDILKHKTLRAMSKTARFGTEVEASKPGNGHRTYKICEIASNIPDDDVEDVTTATDWQAWCIGQGLLKAHGWHDYMILKLSKEFDVERLRHVCEQLVEKHAILRTVFAVKSRQTFQVVLKPRAYPFQFTIKESGDQKADEVVKEVIKEDMTRHKQLTDPLVAFMLIQDSSNATKQLIFRISHAQYDGACIHKLWRSLETLYLNKPLEVIPFKTFCEEASFASKNSEPFWKEVLANSSMSEVRRHTHPSIDCPINNAARLSTPMIDFKAAGFTQATAILTSWSIVLSKLTGQNSVVFGYIGSGRDLPMPGISDVIGGCLNVLPLRTDIQATTQTSELLSSVQSNYLKSLQHGHLGHYHIIENCTTWPRWTRFSTIVNLVSLGSINLPFSGIGECSFDYYEPEHDKADLWLHTFVKGSDLEIELRYSTKAFSHDWVNTVLEYFVDVYKQLPNILAHPLEEKLPTLDLTLPEDNSTTSQQLNGKVSTPADHLTTLEAKILACWESVFGIHVRSDPEFSRETPFYEIWGNAIAAPALAYEYSRNDLPTSCEEVYEYPSIAQTLVRLSRRSNGVVKEES